MTFETLHTASLAAPPLRLGLNGASAGKSARHLRTLLGTPAVAISDTERALDNDLADYVARATEAKVREGLSPADARRAALIESISLTIVGDAPSRH